MNNKRFELLLKVINFLSIVTLEKHWRNGVRFVFKKKKNDSRHSSKSETMQLPVNTVPEHIAS
jgi:hypothetical protein